MRCFVHDYGSWSNPRNGVKSRRCKKCRNVDTERVGEIGRLICRHDYPKDSYKKTPNKICKKCGKSK